MQTPQKPMYKVYVPISSKCHNLYSIQQLDPRSSVTNCGWQRKCNTPGTNERDDLMKSKELQLLLGQLDENSFRFCSQVIHENQLQSKMKVKYKNSD